MCLDDWKRGKDREWSLESPEGDQRRGRGAESRGDRICTGDCLTSVLLSLFLVSSLRQVTLSVSTWKGDTRDAADAQGSPRTRGEREKAKATAVACNHQRSSVPSFVLQNKDVTRDPILLSCLLFPSLFASLLCLRRDILPPILSFIPAQERLDVCDKLTLAAYSRSPT